ncbi:Imm1 family immunity protein [Actinosynnema sp. ALI-1.44]|uniref:Imm1 family immunity protein n=1 Tax=Actinosynnema sp. ALI-1.44 TaxID=1933779 RepID=UPI00143DACA4|nr:Imm1 family immunity protein [Actinosynnema sp. ALI-1.44]
MTLDGLDEQGDKSVIATTPAELDGALNRLRLLSRGRPVLAEASVENPMAVLSIGVHGDRGVLYYSGADHVEGAFSTGDSGSDVPEILYYYMGSDTSFPPNSEIPIEAVRQAAHEFMTTGQRPTGVQWQPRPAQTGPVESEWPL